MLPKTLKYGSKVESAMAKSSRVNIAPQNGTGPYYLGDTIIFNLPTRNNLVMATTESYLKFQIAITSLAANNVFRWDSCGAHGCIQRIRIFHGSNLLQDIDNYGLLAKILFDLQQPTDSTYGKETMLCGTRSDLVVTTPTVAAVADISAKAMPAYQINSGERVGGDRVALAAANAVLTEVYCLNLLSLIGSLSSSNYLPLFAMTSAPLRCEITLVDSLYKGCSDLTSNSSATSGTIQLTNVEYVANFIELGDQAMSVIYGSLEGQPLQYCVPDFRNYQFTYSIPDATATQVTMPIPAKFSSLKSIITTSRDKGSGIWGGFFPFSSVTCGLKDYQFRIGSTIMPPKAPSTNAEFFCEALKAMGSIADLNYTPSIDKSSYAMSASAASNDSATVVSSNSSGAFYIGLDLENYCASPKDTIFAGYNSNTDDIFLQMNYNAVTRGAALNIRWDSFASFDSVLVFENNSAYVKF